MMSLLFLFSALIVSSASIAGPNIPAPTNVTDPSGATVQSSAGRKSFPLTTVNTALPAPTKNGRQNAKAGKTSKAVAQSKPPVIDMGCVSTE